MNKLRRVLNRLGALPTQIQLNVGDRVSIIGEDRQGVILEFDLSTEKPTATVRFVDGGETTVLLSMLRPAEDAPTN